MNWCELMAVFIILIKGYCSGTKQMDCSSIYKPQHELIPRRCLDAGYCEQYNATPCIESKLMGYIITCTVAKSLDGEWYFILNTPDFSQDIVVGLCRAENEPCSGVEDEYESKCLQGRVPRYLYALNHTGEIFRCDFMMPVYCTCVIKEKN